MSKRGHIPIRMCAGCRSRRKKEDLLRFIRASEGMVLTKRKEDWRGRGIYLCPDEHCFRTIDKRMKKEGLWDRSIPAGVWVERASIDKKRGIEEERE